jgi:2-oxoacid:acceptor oxidoreductase gamma subunit (pyruvate/2-ketoisovalerate family)
MPARPDPLPLEIRVHGRGGQGGVTCAKLVASLHAEQGLHVQTFGDYGSERAGAPVRAFTRVDTAPITNRNKVYRPHHLLVLDAGLLGDDVLDGAAPGTTLLVNTARGPDALGERYRAFRLATVDATAIARRHGIGTSALVIVNTTLVGAYARALGLPFELVERVYAALGVAGDLPAARQAFEAVRLRQATPGATLPAPGGAADAAVPGIAEQLIDLPTPLKTGAWRTQHPAYRPHQAPCSAACPAGNDVVGFVQALGREGVEAAARLLLETQPLPSVCGRVCPAPCMSVCNRAAYDGAVDVRGLERWIGDHLEGGLPAPPRLPRPLRVAVVGGGPAGISAAWTLARAGHAVAVHDAGPALGGVLRTGIPAYRLPDEVLDRDLSRLLALGVEVRCGAPLDAEAVRGLAATHDAVVLATGLPRLATLDVPGAGLRGLAQGIRFLDAVKAGRAPRLAGHVVVVGGGNTAVDCARTALRCGAARVTIAYRRGRSEMPAIPAEIDEALAEGVALLPLRQPVRFAGSEQVTGVELAEAELGPPDASGRRRPVLTDRRVVLPCDGVMLAIGQSADLSLLPRGWTVRDGRAVGEGGAPLAAWLAGDMVTGEGTVTHAVGSGRRAAERLLRALGQAARPEPPAGPPEERVTAAHVRYDHFAPAPPAAPRHLAPERRVGGFAEVELGLASPEEAGRCFSCGSCTLCDTCLLSCPEGIIRRDGDGYQVDGDYCKGCGMCVAECPRRAMEMALDAAVR